MVQSVELVLDPVLEDRVRAQWRVLMAADLPSQGRHTGPTNRPHVTLTVAQGVGPEHEQRLVEAVAAGPRLPLAVRLGGLVLLGAHKHVLARLVVPSADLLRLQSAVHASWGDALHVPQHLAPGAWTPHVTLAMHLTDTQVGQALTALRRMPEAGPGSGPDDDGEAVAVRRWDSTARAVWEPNGPLEPSGPAQPDGPTQPDGPEPA